ncbi:hypothetical protein ACTFIR_000065 [Dictyostelium discoideum]
MFKQIIIISLIILTFLNFSSGDYSPILKKNINIRNDFLVKTKEINNEFLKQKKLNSISKLSNSYQVSKNCSDEMDSILDFSNPDVTNMMMIMYSGIGFNELGNYGSCIALPSNTTQYCLFEGNFETETFYIGVCYPSSKYCSQDDIIGLMTQYTILNVLQFEMSFNASNNLNCYNSEYQTVKIQSNAGTWVLTGISIFFLSNIFIGTIIDYLLIYKLKQYRKNYNSQQSLLNPKSYYEPNLLNLQQQQQDGDEDFNQLELTNNNERIKDLTPPFYGFIFDKFDKSNNDYENYKLVKYFQCWSLIKNFNSLINSSNPKGYFQSLDGIRTLGTCWVILGHTILFATDGFGIDNLESLGGAFSSFSFQVIFAGEFAVDTFFTLSGFLVAYSLIIILNKIQKERTTIGQSIKFWILYVIHRVVRLIPLYYFLIFFSMWVMPLMGSGPIYYQFETFAKDQCSNYWWTNILFINNFYLDECYGVSWYLANDMQFFLLTPFIIVLYRKSKPLGWILAVSIMIASMMATLAVSIKYKIPTFFDLLGTEAEIVSPHPTSQLITNIYQKPYYRIGAYIVGILIAFIYTDSKLSKKVRYFYYLRTTRYLLYCISLFITFFLSYISFDFYKNSINFVGNWTTIQKSFYNGFSHTTFSIGVSIIILATFYGYGGIVQWFLKLGIWKFFSKLTYSSYLVHPLVIAYRLYSMTNFLHYSTIEFSILYIGNVVTTFAAAFVIHLLIEKPFINLERLIFSSK